MEKGLSPRKTGKHLYRVRIIAPSIADMRSRLGGLSSWGGLIKALHEKRDGFSVWLDACGSNTMI